MKQSEVDVIKAAAKLHTAVTAYGRHSVEADVAIGELVAVVDKTMNAKPKCKCGGYYLGHAACEGD